MEAAAHRIWGRIERTAIELAQLRSRPSARHAHAIIYQLIREEGAGMPAGHTVASLAKELLRAIGAAA